MKKTILLAVLLMAVCSFPAAAAEWVRVTVNNANVRSQPSLSGELLLKAGAGDEFEVLAKISGWFKIRLPETSGSKASEGFISAALTELVTGLEAPAANQGEPARAKAPARPSRAVKPAISGEEKIFSGLSAKFGYMTKPAGSFGDRWLLAFTYEKGINPFLAAGLEFQPYFRSFSDAEFSSSTLGANIFLNAKGGVNIGRFVENLKLLTPYIGFGLGGAFAASSSKFEGEKVSDVGFNFAWHMLFGIEVVLKNMSAILEFQILKVSLPDIDPDPTQYFWMIGIRF
jgi:opacity protein-like surface antigen